MTRELDKGVLERVAEVIIEWTSGSLPTPTAMGQIRNLVSGPREAHASAPYDKGLG